MKIRQTVLAALLVLCGATAVPVYAQPSRQTAPATTVEAGSINGAAFRIEIPANWNKGLVMWAHGYTTVGTPPPNPDNPRVKALREVFLSRGFAFAQSAYSTQGWAVKEGIEDLEAARSAAPRITGMIDSLTIMRERRCHRLKRAGLGEFTGIGCGRPVQIWQRHGS